MTIYMPERSVDGADGADSFASLDSAAAVDAFLAQHYPTAHALMPDATREMLTNPVRALREE